MLSKIARIKKEIDSLKFKLQSFYNLNEEADLNSNRLKRSLDLKIIDKDANHINNDIRE